MMTDLSSLLIGHLTSVNREACTPPPEELAEYYERRARAQYQELCEKGVTPSREIRTKPSWDPVEPKEYGEASSFYDRETATHLTIDPDTVMLTHWTEEKKWFEDENALWETFRRSVQPKGLGSYVDFLERCLCEKSQNVSEFTLRLRDAEDEQRRMKLRLDMQLKNAEHKSAQESSLLHRSPKQRMKAVEGQENRSQRQWPAKEEHECIGGSRSIGKSTPPTITKFDKKRKKRRRCDDEEIDLKPQIPRRSKRLKGQIAPQSSK